MDLCHEDKLRLNVLLAQTLQAIRIDESRMEVHALSEKGEAKVLLHANCKDEKYLKLVRQWLSTNVLGSPGGYPVYLRRWTRMGQARDDSLQKLLLLGEPEAVVAVVHANGITNELARRAWWCIPSAEHARCLLENKEVAQGSMGPELAQFLVEFLPFEESSKALMNSVRLVLQPNLISQNTVLDIWKRGKRKNTYYVGFLQQRPNALPVNSNAHHHFEEFNERISKAVSSNEMLDKLRLVLGPQGQAAMDTFTKVLAKPNDQEVAVETFNTLRHYFHLNKIYPVNWRHIEELNEYAHHEMREPSNMMRIAMDTLPQASDYFFAILYLSMVSETLLNPVFGVTNAIGSVMRKRITHLTDPILEQLHKLN